MAQDPPKLNITPEMREEIAKILATPAEEIDNPDFEAELRRCADEHMEILRLSKEASLRNPRVYR